MWFCRSQPPEDEISLLRRAAESFTEESDEKVTSEVLGKITRLEGVDFATALLFDRFQNSAAHSEFIRRMDSLRERSEANRPFHHAKLVIVPGALYRERPEMGGDGRIVLEVAKEFGWSTDFIPTSSFGSIQTNANLICEWMSKHSKEKIILVSLSKGSADLKVALASIEAPRLFQNVAAWVNVCGPLDGSRMANWFLEHQLLAAFVQFQCLVQRRDVQFVKQMQHGPKGLLAFSLPSPASMRVFTLMGFPLKRHMSTPFSRFCHRILSAWGPNDGTTSLSDLRSWPGKIYPAWGMDHYFRPEAEARSLVRAMLHYLAEDTFK